MTTVDFPYGKGKMTYDFSGERFNGVLTSGLQAYAAKDSGIPLIKAAMEHPIGSPRLSELAMGKHKIVIIASDHTRPVPSKLISPC